jgi:DNA-binding transcriptional MerR regulator
MSKKDTIICPLSIGQVSKKLSIEAHTIRFWCSEFPHIKCILGKGGRRYYNQDAINELEKIKDLLYVKGMRIEGVKKIVKYNKIKQVDIQDHSLERFGTVSNQEKFDKCNLLDQKKENIVNDIKAAIEINNKIIDILIS